MTLRDCSMYVCLLHDGTIELFLCDLDHKASSKLQHWVATEAALLSGGYYGESAPLLSIGPEVEPCHALIGMLDTGLRDT